MTVIARLLERTLVYRAWQAPFAEQKFAPILLHNDVRSIRRVLDVGCGPGTNTHHFAPCEYLGLDVNPEYVDHARRRHKRDFLVADVTQYTAPEGAQYDCILVNSFLHHIDRPDTRRILSHLRSLLTRDGYVHVLELVLPEGSSVARLLARWDRGAYARPLAEWHALLGECFEPVVFEPYRLTVAGVTLWNMVYFKGRARR